ncbi:MAG: hypothetical protein A3F41_00805 [Coxiella sp. RIFCSPHIGHO2_12_FULL_44_14]|nr:MAG: hypothetical protein A3F41_00805 [Coxiella sp. RIFCSPHIGHO2_12_FULL_44_14]
MNKKRKIVGWQLLKDSLVNLLQCPTLLLLALCSTLLSLTLLAGAALLLWYCNTFLKSYWWSITLLLLSLWLCRWFFTLGQASLITVAIARWQERPVPVTQGITTALAFALPLAKWTLLNSTLGAILRLWQTPLARQGILSPSLSDTPWIFISYLVIPILLFEKKGVFKSIERSAQLLRKTWGSTLRSNLSWGTIALLIRISSIIPLIVGALLGGNLNLLIGGSITLLLFILLTTIQAAVQALLLSSLYLYATQKTATLPLNNSQQLADAFYTKLTS